MLCGERGGMCSVVRGEVCVMIYFMCRAPKKTGGETTELLLSVERK